MPRGLVTFTVIGRDAYLGGLIGRIFGAVAGNALWYVPDERYTHRIGYSVLRSLATNIPYISICCSRCLQLNRAGATQLKSE